MKLNNLEQFSYFRIITLEFSYFTIIKQGRRQEGGGVHPPETEKIVVEKWCYFPELYKITEVREDG